MDFAALVEKHPALGKTTAIGTSGFPLPAMADAQVIDVDEAGIARLKAFGLRVAGDPGRDNRVILDQAAMKPVDIRIDFGGRTGNTLVLEAPHSLRGQIQFLGDGHLAMICRGWYSLKIDFVDRDSALYIGPNSSVGDAYCWIQGNEKSLIIGEDCMFAWGIGLRTGDAHGVIDIDKRAMSNEPRDVLIGAHVWLAQDVLVFKGIEIGTGSVVGARAVVSKSLPPKCAANGSPARVLRKNTTWCRPAVLETRQIDDLLARSYMKEIP
jgi:acetyltransferase-like isoleucine patch superfamily enzyme